MQHHNISFFGQKAGIILDSAKIADPFLYFRFIKKKADGNWEKPSLNEGKTVKFNLLELCAVGRLLHQPNGTWSTVHKRGEIMTSIIIEKTDQQCLIKAGEYMRNLHDSEIDLLSRLLDHLITEKIENATDQAKNVNIQKEVSYDQEEIPVEYELFPKNHDTHEQNKHELQPQREPKEPQKPSQIQALDIENPFENEPKSRSNNQHSEIKPLSEEKKLPEITPISHIDPMEWLTNLQTDGDFLHVPGVITANRPQAVNFQINGLKAIWVPKSTCKTQNLENPELDSNALWIKKWFVEKKLPDIFGVAE